MDPKISCSFVLVGVLLWPAIIRPQAPSTKPGGTGGIATGGTSPAVYDSEKRPITAGGFVKTGPIVFMNTAEQAGLTRWRHKAGTPEKRFILEAKGPGVALLDYDNDGWLDIYFVNGSTVAALNGKEESPHAALFHNNHDGHLPMSPPRRSNK